MADPGPRPRSRVLVAGALLLGPLLGGGVGYAIQAGRPPTPLPPLRPASAPRYPAAPLEAPAASATPAPAPTPAAVDGDLRPLLLPVPAGAQAWDDYGIATPGDWESASQLARESGGSASAFETLLTAGFRRAVMTCWQQDGVKYRVQLIQYFPDRAGSAVDRVDAARRAGTPFPDGLAGGYRAAGRPASYFESDEQFYDASAVTRRGDLVVSVTAYGSAQLPAERVRDLAEQQWERLA
ncbi:hypothetical protein [Kitasatospora sp. LaBMicrA B282]|uniref:hypothetical protein n=1 Tax=Kitasatospora sp. LaBMicrA B282 TaxID=3420949 RepID=UPI003D098757